MDSNFDMFSFSTTPAMNLSHDASQLAQMDPSLATIPPAAMTTRFCSEIASTVAGGHSSPDLELTCDEVTDISEFGAKSLQFTQMDPVVPAFPDEGPTPSWIDLPYPPERISSSSVETFLEEGSVDVRSMLHPNAMKSNPDQRNSADCQNASVATHHRTSQSGGTKRLGSTGNEAEGVTTKTAPGSSIGASSLAAGHFVFDAAMQPTVHRKLRKKTRGELEAFRTLRTSGGACKKHKTAKKAVSCSFTPFMM